MHDESMSGTLQEASMTREAVQAQLEKVVADFESLGARLRVVHGSLPISPREDLMLLGEEDPDFYCVVRGAIECGLNDHLKPLVQMLLATAKSEAK
jgi:hypothetical protein